MARRTAGREALAARRPAPVSTPGRGITTSEGGGWSTVSRISPWSVLKACAVLSLLAVPLALLGAAGLWLVASWVGVVGDLEEFVGELLAVRDFHLEPVPLLGLGAVIGYAVALVATVVALVAVVLYNTAARLRAGVDVRLRAAGEAAGPVVPVPGGTEADTDGPVPAAQESA